MSITALQPGGAASAAGRPHTGRSALRVHVLIDSLTWGGAEALLADFAAGAPSVGLELSVGYLQDRSGNPAAVRLRERGIEPERVGIESLLHPRDLRRVRRQLERVRPDVVHTHLGYSDFLGGIAARRLGIPAVSTLHVMEFGSGLRHGAKERLMALARRRCTGTVIAVSDSAREWFVAEGWDKPGRVVTVRNGIEDRRRAGAGAAVRTSLGIAPDRLVVGMLGVLREGKGHAEAAAAVAALRERFPSLTLLVAGDGPARADVERALEPLGDGGVLAGWREDTAEVLDAVDVLLHPSRVDAFPTALIEALAAGVPIVATAVGGIPEIVDAGATGVLVPAPPAPEALVSALEPLLSDGERRARMGTSAREAYVERFTAERWAARTREVYERVIAARTAA